MTETWKEVPGYPGYEVSDQGRVRSWRSKRYPGKRRKKPWVLRPWTNSEGYLRVSLCKDGKRDTRLVHRVVLSAFDPDPPAERFQGEHLDGSKDNNKLANLRWSTPKENNARKHEHGTQPKRGEESHQARLTEDQVREIRRLKAEEGWSFTKLGKHFGVSDVACSKIVRRKTWSHVK